MPAINPEEIGVLKQILEKVVGRGEKAQAVGKAAVPKALDYGVRLGVGVPTAAAYYNTVTPDKPTGLERVEGGTAAGLMGLAASAMASPKGHMEAWQTGDYQNAIEKLVKRKAVMAGASLVPSAALNIQRTMANASNASGSMAEAARNTATATKALPDIAHNVSDTSGQISELTGTAVPAAKAITSGMGSLQQMTDTLNVGIKNTGNALNDAGKWMGDHPMATKATAIGAGGLAGAYLLSKMFNRPKPKPVRPVRASAAKVTLRHPGDYNIHYNEDDPQPKAAALAMVRARIKTAVDLRTEAQRQGLIPRVQTPQTTVQRPGQPAVKQAALARISERLHCDLFHRRLKAALGQL